MKRLRLLVLILFVSGAAVFVAGLFGPGRHRLEEMARTVIAREVGAALHVPCTLDALSLSLAPPQVVVRGLRLGTDGAVASLGEARIALRARTSLRQRRPVLDVEADAVALDLPALLQALPAADAEPPTPLPPFRIRRLRVTAVRAQVLDGAQPLQVEAPLVEGQVTVDAGSGRLRFAARVAPMTLAGGGRSLTLTQFAARGGESATGWRLRHLAVRGDGLTVNGTERDETLALVGDLELARLAVLEASLAALRGTVRLDGTLTGSLEEPTLAATASVPGFGVDDRDLGDVEVALRADPAALTVTSARLRGLGGEVQGSATLRFVEALPFSGTVSWRGLALRDVAGPAGADLPAAALDGAVDASGALDPLRLAVSGSGTVTAPGRASPVRWTGSGRTAGGTGDLAVELAQGAGNTVAAELRLAADGGLGGQLRLRVADPDGLADLAAIESLPEVRGALEATASLAGTVRAPQLQGTVAGRGLSLAGARIDSVAGTFAADRSAVRVGSLRAALAGGTIDARGTVALDRGGTNDWRVDAQGLDGGSLAALLAGLAGPRLPIAGGTFALTATASGPWPRVQLTGSAGLDDFWLGRERIARADAAVRAVDGAWSLDASMRNRAAQRVVLRASGRGEQDLAIDLACEAWTLTSLWQGERADLGGTLRAAAALRGPARGLSGTATVAADDLVLGGRALGTLQVDVRADRGAWHAETAVLEGSLRFGADVRPGPGLPFTVDGSWQDADFARLLGAAPDLHLISSGRLRAGGRLDAVAAFEARVDVGALTFTGGARSVTADTPLAVVCRQGRCTLEGLTLRSGDSALRVGGDAGFDGRVRLTLAGGGTLALLELLGPPIESARGTFTIDATIAHGPSGWTLLGTLLLDQVALDAGLPVAITRGSGRLALDGTRIRIETLQGRVGTGRFTVDGQVDLREGPALTWTLVDVGVDPLPSLEVELSGSGALEGAWEQLLLRGDVRINQLLYDRQIALTDFLPSFNRALAAAPRPGTGRDLALALTIDAPGELYVENNLARLEARAHLSIGGTAAHPLIEGRVETLDGEIFLRGRTFEILGATVDFRPDLGMAAALNLSAESLIETSEGAYAVGVRVTGTTLEPRVTLSSDDPGLSQTDIATLIAFGKTTAQMRRDGGSFSLNGVLGFGTQQVGDLLTGEAEQVLPVDRIEFTPTFSSTTGAFEPQLTIGKDLTDNLSASIGQSFGVSARTRVEVDYRLGPRVSVPLSWESETETEAGAFAGGIRLRYEFWRLTPWTLLSGLR